MKHALSMTGIVLLWSTVALAQLPRVFPEGTRPDDHRLDELRTLNSYFPFHPVTADQWPQRQNEIRRRILLSQGLWPMPSKSKLNAVIHGRVEREDYVVDRVYFESIPGHYVTGSLYRPKKEQNSYPAILSPHGHWRNGRFYDAGEAQVGRDLESAAERFQFSGRFPIQARAVQLARMGCMVFVYDMTGNADSIQIGHRPDNRASHLDGAENWGFFSTQAELRLQNMMGLQTWNSIRSVDFLLSLSETDPTRIGVTGASGGGTQSMILGAIDERIAAAMPCVMVSTSMQGGCTCENAPYLRIDQGNIDIAAALAPRPLGLTAADDWTVELQSKGYPELVQLYSDLGNEDRLTAAFHVRFKHNYNSVNRAEMYRFFNRHFSLGFDGPIVERDFEPLSHDEATVWTTNHAAPSGDAVGDSHEVEILRIADKDSDARIRRLIPDTADGYARFERIVGGAWETILGRRIDQVGDVQWVKRRVTQQAGSEIRLGTLSHGDEQIPVAEVRPPASAPKGTVVWLSDRGKAGLFERVSTHPMVAKLAGAGYAVVSADLFQQGEFLDKSGPLEAQRMWQQGNGSLAWQRFSGYTFGYNHPVFVKRVHDVLTVVKHLQDRDGEIVLVGRDRQAGILAIAAASQAGDSIDHLYADLDGFRFESLESQDDPMFVPGAVKYLDVDGLLALCVQRPTEVSGVDAGVAKQVASAIGASKRFRVHSSDQALDAAILAHAQTE